MVIAIDAGNTNIHWGWFSGSRLARRAVCPSEDFNAAKGASVIKRGLGRIGHDRVEGAVIVSVSPVLTRKLLRCLTHAHPGVKPVIVSARLKSPLKYGYQRPGTLGADRVANAVGALIRYQNDVVVISAGTATTIDVIFKDGWFPGGMIMPGIETGLWALTRKTALLKNVRLRTPKRTIGHSTGECLRSGILFGHAHMVQSLLELIARQYRRRFLCVVTGGWGKFIASHVRGITRYDRDLSLYGALQLYRGNDLQ
ncbi:MAG TPA: type III pantothenate kinase [bacterium]